jgi:CubicO group peptidase (beta-lactamase class C family)
MSELFKHRYWLIWAVLFVPEGVSGQWTTRLDSLLARQESPGAVVLIQQNGRTLYRRAAGYARLDTREPMTTGSALRMASVSKQFTAMAVLLLEKEGRLKLDDPLSRYLPESKRPVTLRQLLTHTSGIPDYEGRMDTTWRRQLLDRDVWELLKKDTVTYFHPGTAFRYSNSAFCLLSLVVEKASGMPYAQFLQEKIFRPLGMIHTFLYEERAGHPERALGYARNRGGKIADSDQSLTSATRGDGCVYTSADDYLRWHEALSRNQLIDMSEKVRRRIYPFPDHPGYGYGFGWFTAPGGTFFHSGSTCGFSNVVIRRGDLLILFFSNLADNHAFFGKVLGVLDPAIAPGTDWEMLHRLTN